VISSPDRDLTAALPEGTEVVIQPEADGTGGAIRAAIDVVRSSETVLVLSGDHPLISAEVIADLFRAHDEAGGAATVMTTIRDDPNSFGRIIRDERGDLARIVEAKEPGDATPEELAITEVNAGTYVFASEPLAEALNAIGNDNAQGEYYLGDVLPALRDAGHRVATHLITEGAVNLGVNTRVDLARAETEARRLILERHMLDGVTVADPASTWVDAEVRIDPDVTLLPGTTLRGATAIGTASVVGPHTTLIDTVLGKDVKVPHSYLAECEVLDGCAIGPFAHLRPQTVLEQGAKAGAFVEIKNSRIGPESKVPHLSYVGDAELGADVNLGAGTITANYDGFRKHRTVIGDGARIGVDTMLVAPVEVGDAAYTGAGSVIAEDVPSGALGISRAQQENVEGYAERKAAKEEKRG
jgi:bifunctional UDP-N-acetylglucosamine pyrophosphorylase/glucosamine-1-phosphate N-acetyltransferase